MYLVSTDYMRSYVIGKLTHVLKLKERMHLLLFSPKTFSMTHLPLVGLILISNTEASGVEVGFSPLKANQMFVVENVCNHAEDMLFLCCTLYRHC